MPLAQRVAVIWQAVVEVLQQQLLSMRGNGSETTCALQLVIGKRWCTFREGAL